MVAGIDIAGIQPYVFKPDNPFMDDLESYSKAKRLFRDGILSEAVYALEAETSWQPFVKPGIKRSPECLYWVANVLLTCQARQQCQTVLGICPHLFRDLKVEMMITG